MNLQAIMKQAQAMQKDMMKAKEEIDQTLFEGTSSFVKVTMDGTKKLTKVEISKDASLTEEDLEALEDMILLAVNDAMQKVDQLTEEKMGKYTNAMPGLF